MKILGGYISVKQGKTLKILKSRVSEKALFHYFIESTENQKNKSAKIESRIQGKKQHYSESLIVKNWQYINNKYKWTKFRSWVLLTDICY